MLIDSHAHLEAPEFRHDLPEVLARALAADVRAVVTVGSDLDSSRAAIALARQHTFVYAAVGIHPHEAGKASSRDFLDLASLAQDERVVAVGEIGFDFYRNLASPQRQREAFIAQLRLAKDLDKPVIVHDREAHAQVLAILKTDSSPRRGVLHCFSGDPQMAAQARDLGFCVSIAGPVTFPKAHTLHALVPQLSLDQLLVETDCPYLAPHPHRGTRNEPAYVRLVVAKIASLLGMPLEQVAQATTRNAQRLFRFGLD